MTNKNFFFHSSNNRQINLEEISLELFRFMKEAPEYHYRIVIGSDSEPRIDFDDFVTAIIIHRVSRGGRYFWRRVKLKSSPNIRQRIYQEVLLSLEIAQKLITKLKKAENFDFSFEIHIDVGSSGYTKNMVQEVVGMVRGSGFNVKTKPESFGASSVADRHL